MTSPLTALEAAREALRGVNLCADLSDREDEPWVLAITAALAQINTALASLPQTEEQERAEFEKWIRKESAFTDWSRGPDGDYLKLYVKDCWRSWLARAALNAGER